MAGKRPQVVVLGGGFGGLKAARTLRRAPVDVLLLDRTNHHVFQPLLYQVATSGLSPANIASPIRSVFRNQPNVQVLLDEAVSIDLPGSKVVCRETVLPYDFLIVATGAETNYFAHPEWEHFAVGLKDLDDALEVRRRILLAFEAAERETDSRTRERLLTFVVVGGGATGVELAGAIAELSRFVLASDFRRIRPGSARVLLLEAGSRILSAYPEDLAAEGARELEHLGVSIRRGAKVTQIDERGVHLGDELIPSATVMWGAGVKGTALARSMGIKLDRQGRVEVLPDLSVPGHPNVFVVGDAACFTHDPFFKGTPLPGVAPVAMQQGPFAAHCIIDTLEGRSRRTFRYHDKGSLATIGRSAAIADIQGIKLHGFIAWLSWLFIHILFIIGFRNRFVVMFDWVWSYLTYQRGARLITGHRMTAGAPPKKDGVNDGAASARAGPTRLEVDRPLE